MSETTKITDSQARMMVIEWMRSGTSGGRSSAGLRFSYLGAARKAELLQAAKDDRLGQMEKPECKVSKKGSQGAWHD